MYGLACQFSCYLFININQEEWKSNHYLKSFNYFLLNVILKDVKHLFRPSFINIINFCYIKLKINLNLSHNNNNYY